MNRAKKLRRTAELFRDEFRAMSCRYPPIYHERFLSPLAVEPEGWQAFANVNQTRTDGWERWHVAPEWGGLGRFYGSPEGWKDFSGLMDELLTTLSMAWSSNGAVSEWMDIVYDLAEIGGTSLLNVERHVWGWEPDHHECPDFGGVEDVEPYLQIWDERSFGDAEFPKHPLHRVLTLNVFSASVVALEILIDPESLFLWKAYDPDDLPIPSFETADDDEDRSAANASLQLQPEALRDGPPLVLDRTASAEVTSDSRPDCLFSKDGDIWEIRFRSGGVVESGKFVRIKGLAHLQKLVLIPNHTFPAIELDPKSLSTTSKSAISQDEAMSELGDDEASGFNREGATRQLLLGDDTVRYLAEMKISLEQQIESETDSAEKKKLTTGLATVKKQLNQRRRTLEGQGEASKAFRRVKKAIYDARQKLKKEMPLLADHLSAWVQPVGNGFRYVPQPECQWYSVTDD